jgi:hypothetical protein
VDLGIDISGPHPIHPDAFPGDFPGQDDGHGIDGTLGSIMIHVFPGRSQARRDLNLDLLKEYKKLRVSWQANGSPPTSNLGPIFGSPPRLGLTEREN